MLRCSLCSLCFCVMKQGVWIMLYFAIEMACIVWIMSHCVWVLPKGNREYTAVYNLKCLQGMPGKCPVELRIQETLGFSRTPFSLKAKPHVCFRADKARKERKKIKTVHFTILIPHPSEADRLAAPHQFSQISGLADKISTWTSPTAWINHALTCNLLLASELWKQHHSLPSQWGPLSTP